VNVLIVDDEQPARDELRWLLEQCSGLDIAGEADSASSARDAIETQGPLDLVFLDIDMPGVDGMRLAESFEAYDRPLVIFVTAYEEFAVDAFDVEAVDYLLKPVRLERLQKAVERARRRLAPRDEDEPSVEGDDGEGDPESDGPLTRISVEHEGAYRVLETAEILYFESVDGRVWTETPDGRYATDFSLKFLEQHLDAEEFFRCHRSCIVRLEAIESIVPAGAGTYRLQLTEPPTTDDASGEPSTVPLARSRADELKRRMPWSDR
jgi:two-component system LytT family response regulator/two-component system response regulator LytT